MRIVPSLAAFAAFTLSVAASGVPLDLGPALGLEVEKEKPAQQEVELDVPGVFHTPIRGDEFKRFDIAADPRRTYSRLEVEVDFTVGPFHKNNRGAAHNILQVIRHPRWQGNVMQYVNYFPKTTIFKNTNNFDRRKGKINRTDTRYRLQIGHTYHLETVFTHKTHSRIVRLYEGGVLLRELRDKFTGPLRFKDKGNGINGPGVMIAFGHIGDERGGEEATFGWSYGNLKVRLIP